VIKSRCGSKIGGKYNMHKDKKKAYILVRICEENRTPGGLGLGGRVILKWIKEDMRMPTYTSG
jgi:hypothetical protein